MTDDTPHVSDEPITVGLASADGRGGKTMDILRQYLPPLDGSDDRLREFDQWLAHRVAEVLVKKYFGYEWLVVADSRQGVIYFRIPDLMGTTLNYVIRLAEYGDLTPELITRCGGELLERMYLPRSDIDMALYIDAKRNRRRFDFADVPSGSRA